MPKDTTLRSILVIGSGPIVIGQAAEFDYSGTQGCLALKEEGYRVILSFVQHIRLVEQAAGSQQRWMSLLRL